MSTYFLFSLLAHLALLSFLLSLPLYMRGFLGADSFREYFVSLKTEKEAAGNIPSVPAAKEKALKAEKIDYKKSPKATEKVVKSKVAEKVAKPKAEIEKKEEIMPAESEKPQQTAPLEVQETETASSYSEQPQEETIALKAESGSPELETPEAVDKDSGLLGKDGDADKQSEPSEKIGREIVGRTGVSLPASGASGTKPDVPSPKNGQGIISIMSDNKPGDRGDIVASITSSETKEIKKAEGAPHVGVPLPPAIILRDIRIEVLIEGPEPKGFSVRINKKPHPTLAKTAGSKLSDVNFTGETAEMKDGGEIKIKRIFFVASAEKGIYNFIMGNKGDREYNADVVFRIYEGNEKAKTKKYGPIRLTPNSMIGFKFILPEAVFWDDDEYFSGRIEDSNSMTKFKHETDLIWREEKDY